MNAGVNSEINSNNVQSTSQGQVISDNLWFVWILKNCIIIYLPTVITIEYIKIKVHQNSEQSFYQVPISHLDLKI